MARIAVPDFAQNIVDELRRFGKAPAYKHMHEVYRDIFTSLSSSFSGSGEENLDHFSFFLKDEARDGRQAHTKKLLK